MAGTRWADGSYDARFAGKSLWLAVENLSTEARRRPIPTGLRLKAVLRTPLNMLTQEIGEAVDGALLRRGMCHQIERAPRKC